MEGSSELSNKIKSDGYFLLDILLDVLITYFMVY